MTAKGDHKGINTNKRDEELFKSSSEGAVEAGDGLSSALDGRDANREPYLVDPVGKQANLLADHDNRTADLAAQGLPAASDGEGKPMTPVGNPQEEISTEDTLQCQATHITQEANVPMGTPGPSVAAVTAPEDAVIVHAEPAHQLSKSFLLYVDNEVLVSQIISQFVAPAGYLDPGSVPESSILHIMGDHLLLVPCEQPLRHHQLKQFEANDGTRYVVAIELPAVALTGIAGHAVRPDMTLSPAESIHELGADDLAFVADPGCAISFPVVTHVLFQEEQHKSALPLISPNLFYNTAMSVCDLAVFNGDNVLDLSALRSLAATLDADQADKGISPSRATMLSRLRGYLLAALAASPAPLRNGCTVNPDLPALQVMSECATSTSGHGTRIWNDFVKQAMHHFDMPEDDTIKANFDGTDVTPFCSSGNILTALASDPAGFRGAESSRRASSPSAEIETLALGSALYCLVTNSSSVFDDRQVFWRLFQHDLETVIDHFAHDGASVGPNDLDQYVAGIDALLKIQSGHSRMSPDMLSSYTVLRALWCVAGSANVSEFEARLASLTLRPGENRLAWGLLGASRGISALPARFKCRQDLVALVDTVIGQAAPEMSIVVPQRLMAKQDKADKSRDTFTCTVDTGFTRPSALMIQLAGFRVSSALLAKLRSTSDDGLLKGLLRSRLFPASLAEISSVSHVSMRFSVQNVTMTISVGSERTTVFLPIAPKEIQLALPQAIAAYENRHPGDIATVQASGKMALDRPTMTLTMADLLAVSNGADYVLSNVDWRNWSEYKSSLLQSVETWEAGGFTQNDLESLAHRSMTETTHTALEGSRRPPVRAVRRNPTHK